MTTHTKKTPKARATRPKSRAKRSPGTATAIRRTLAAKGLRPSDIVKAIELARASSR